MRIVGVLALAASPILAGGSREPDLDRFPVEGRASMPPEKAVPPGREVVRRRRS